MFPTIQKSNGEIQLTVENTLRLKRDGRSTVETGRAELRDGVLYVRGKGTLRWREEGRDGGELG